jgi:D-tagatose-1,6-bisphosphate aldolase subunit GatZ/KbaZ
MDRLMTAQPKYWQAHYSAGDNYARHFGYADRIRYYWPDPAVQAVISKLQTVVDKTVIPDPVLRQFFAPSVLDRADSLSGTQFTRLIHTQIEIALAPYDIHKEGDTA